MFASNEIEVGERSGEGTTSTYISRFILSAIGEWHHGHRRHRNACHPAVVLIYTHNPAVQLGKYIFIILSIIVPIKVINFISYYIINIFTLNLII